MCICNEISVWNDLISMKTSCILNHPCFTATNWHSVENLSGMYLILEWLGSTLYDMILRLKRFLIDKARINKVSLYLIAIKLSFYGCYYFQRLPFSVLASYYNLAMWWAGLEFVWANINIHTGFVTTISCTLPHLSRSYLIRTPWLTSFHFEDLHF